MNTGEEEKTRDTRLVPVINAMKNMTFNYEFMIILAHTFVFFV